MTKVDLISDDTYYLEENDIFIAKKGKNIKIDELIDIALTKKPKLIITNKKNNISNVKYVKNINKYEKSKIKNYTINPCIIGVTGTNGKTSTTTIIYNILKKLNKKVMLIGSNGVYYNNLKLKTRNTTISKLSILYLINKYLDNNSYLIMELSSQSYKRIKNFKFDFMIFTNLNKEHLDAHKTMHRYYKAKLKIINLLKNKKNLFVNIDDKYGDKLVKRFPCSQKYSLKDLLIKSNDQIEFIYNNNIILSPLKGDFNIYNIYSSYLLVSELIDEKEKIIEMIKDINKIEGRNEVLEYKNNKIVIDYAHTPDSFNNIISFYSKQNFENLYILFGFGGNKDRSKRKEMLEIAFKYSNNLILTEDNSRNEPFVKIMKSALRTNINNLVIIENRKEAIRYSISRLNDNDCLLILGKGNEDYMLKKGKSIQYSDFKEVEKWLS